MFFFSLTAWDSPSICLSINQQTQPGQCFSGSKKRGPQTLQRPEYTYKDSCAMFDSAVPTADGLLFPLFSSRLITGSCYRSGYIMCSVTPRWTALWHPLQDFCPLPEVIVLSTVKYNGPLVSTDSTIHIQLCAHRVFRTWQDTKSRRCFFDSGRSVASSVGLPTSQNTSWMWPEVTDVKWKWLLVVSLGLLRRQGSLWSWCGLLQGAAYPPGKSLWDQLLDFSICRICYPWRFPSETPVDNKGAPYLLERGDI